MKHAMTRVLQSGCASKVVLLVGLLSSLSASAGPYDAAGQKAANWLIANMIPADKTWGTEQDLKYLAEADVAYALASWNTRTAEYNAALTWLSNHSPPNTDFASRRVLSLQPSGLSTSFDLAYLNAAQAPSLTAPGNGGVGLTVSYQGSTLDTALMLQALYQAGYTSQSNSNVAAAVTYLKTAQLTGTDKGWPLAQETVSDPIATAEAVIALIPYRAADSSLVTPIANALTTLNANVNTSSIPLKKALSALANYRDNSSSSTAATLLGNLVSTQSTDGSFGGDVEATAVGLRAFAAGAGRDAVALRTAVTLNDPNLRAAVNAALSRNALDTLNQGELAQLTTLNISNQGITDLTGLQYASNLTYLDASYNNITSWTPVTSLPQNPTTVRDGNPGYPAPSGDAPLPPWSIMLLGMVLLGMTRHSFFSAKR